MVLRVLSRKMYGFSDGLRHLNWPFLLVTRRRFRLNHPGNRGGCLVKVRQVPQRVLQVDDSIVPQLLPEECRQLTPAGVDG